MHISSMLMLRVTGQHGRVSQGEMCEMQACRTDFSMIQPHKSKEGVCLCRHVISVRLLHASSVQPDCQEGHHTSASPLRHELNDWFVFRLHKMP